MLHNNTVVFRQTGEHRMTGSQQKWLRMLLAVIRLAASWSWSEVKEGGGKWEPLRPLHDIYLASNLARH